MEHVTLLSSELRLISEIFKTKSFIKKVELPHFEHTHKLKFLNNGLVRKRDERTGRFQERRSGLIIDC